MLRPRRFLYFLTVVAGVAVACVVALYLAGGLFLLANKTLPVGLSWNTFLHYWAGYHDDPVQRVRLHIAAAVAVAFAIGGPMLGLATVRAQKRPLHGAARFATSAEIRASGLMGHTGIIVGRTAHRYLMLPGQLFALLAAPTRSGKGVGIVIPNLLHFRDSVVVLDVKQENYDLTSAYRARYGQEVYLLNVFAEDCRTHRWNPLSYISDNPHFRVGDILAIGYILYPQDGKDTFFNDQARNLFLGLVLYLVETPSLPRTIGEALRQSSGKGRHIKDYLSEVIERRQQSSAPLSEACTGALYRFIANSDNTLASILASFNAPLTIWANPIVDAATSTNDFLLTDVRKKRMTIYLGITPDKLPQAGLILNLFFSQLINLNTKELPAKNPALKYQCLLLMDEFAAMGKIQIIRKAVSYMAAYNLRLLPIIQSMAQLASVYGEHDARTLATNHALSILFPPKEQRDAVEYSETLGYFTEKAISRSTNARSGLGSWSGSASRSESVSDQRRALMLPQELREMGQDKEIVILEHTKPILADKIRFYDDHVFLDRLKEVSPRLNRLDRRIGPFHFPHLPTKQQLDDAVHSGELAMPVPVLDLDAHLAQVETDARHDSGNAAPKAGARSIDLGVLSQVASHDRTRDDSELPSAEEVGRIVDGFFSQIDASEGLPKKATAAPQKKKVDKQTPRRPSARTPKKKPIADVVTAAHTKRLQVTGPEKERSR